MREINSQVSLFQSLIPILVPHIFHAILPNDTIEVCCHDGQPIHYFTNRHPNNKDLYANIEYGDPLF
jgi:hypothetical protein